MKILNVLVVLVLIFAIAAAASYAGTTYSYPIIAMYTGNLFTQDPVVTERTVSYLWGTITYVDIVVYWNGGNLCCELSAAEKRDRQGRLTSVTGTTRSYNLSGTLISPINSFTHTYTYDKSGYLSQEQYNSRGYDTQNRLLSSNKTSISYTYNNAGKLQKKTSSASFYDGSGHKVSSSVSTWKYYYNVDGTVRQEVATYTGCIAANVITAYSKSITDYYYMANGDTYNVWSNYDINGKLCGKAAEVSLTDNGQVAAYHVVYTVDENGNIQYTQVYDASYAEIVELGGEGFKTPVDIIGALRNPSLQEGLLIQVDGDTEMANRMSITQSSETQLPDGVSISGSMITESGTLNTQKQ